jgi:hypothetical protein
MEYFSSHFTSVDRVLGLVLKAKFMTERSENKEGQGKRKRRAKKSGEWMSG